jgi:dipeptidyl-peptidase-4
MTLHSTDGKLLKVLSPSKGERLARLERLGLSPPQVFTVVADDGTPLRAMLYLPAGVPSGSSRFAEGAGEAGGGVACVSPSTRDPAPLRHPAIVAVYGGPGSPTVSDSFNGFDYFWSQLLARRGFCVFAVDPRSASDTGKARADTAFKRFYGDGELRDILAGVRYLKSLPFVDPERVGIWGWSGGGSTTLYAMTHSKEFRSGIAVAGVTDYRAYDTVYTERYMRTPAENPEGYRASSPVSSAAGLHGRLLLVHGLADDNVHAQNAFAMIDALIAAGKHFELMIYPGRDHGIGDPAARRHLFGMMLRFWERTLKGAAEEDGEPEKAAPPEKERTF